MGRNQTPDRGIDPQLVARDEKEEARAGSGDHRYNHWTAVRDGLMNAHAELFQQIPAIAKTLPDPVDQMKLFELIQIFRRRRGRRCGRAICSAPGFPTPRS